MAEARSKIILRVENSQLVHMRSRDPKVIWNGLQRIHVVRGFATRMALKRRFGRLVKEEKETMAAWIGPVKPPAYKLWPGNVGIALMDEDKNLTLTNGLDESYESFISTLNATPLNTLVRETVIDRIPNEEMRREDNKPEVKS